MIFYLLFAFITQYIEAYFSQDSFDNVERLLCLRHVMSLSKIFPSRIFLNLAKENNPFLQELAKNDFLFRSILQQLLESFKQNPD